MSYLTVEVEIARGQIVPSEPERIPQTGRGLLTILAPAASASAVAPVIRQRLELPLIRGDGQRLINPTPKELDASLWGD
jgi:hypothetical protein